MLMKKNKASYKKQKRIYIALLILALVALILGVVYYLILGETEKNTVATSLTSFFTSIKEEKIDYQGGLINSISSNLLYGVFIWLLGISIIGIPFVLFAFALKSFTLGFSITSIIAQYHWKGIPLAITYSFPHQFLLLAFAVVLTFYSVNFSWKLFQYLFLKREINFKHSLKRYSKIFLFSSLGFLGSSLFEIFLAPFLMKFFL